MKTQQLTSAAIACSIAATSFAAELPTDPLGGKPPEGSKPSVESFADQMKYQRAFEAVIKYLMFRFYGPEEAFSNKSFKLRDVELVK